MKTSRIHSSSPADRLHFFAISARDTRNCSSGSLSLCFFFMSLCLSNVTFAFIKKLLRDFSELFEGSLEDFHSRNYLAKDFLSFVSKGLIKYGLKFFGNFFKSHAFESFCLRLS